MATEKQEAFDYSGFVAKQGGGSAAQYTGDETSTRKAIPPTRSFTSPAARSRSPPFPNTANDASDTLAETGPLNGGRMETRV